MERTASQEYKRLGSVAVERGSNVIVDILRVVTIRVYRAGEVGIDVQRLVFLLDERRR